MQAFYHHGDMEAEAQKQQAASSKQQARRQAGASSANISHISLYPSIA
jgi:hypothetical protein